MSPAAETRLNMLFKDILKGYEAQKNVGHAPFACSTQCGRLFEPFYALVVNLMHFTCPAATI